MADNTTLDSGTGGDVIATASLTFSGDTAKVQVIAAGILSGAEGSWTYTLYTGGAGAVTAGTPRVTLASDDPAVVALQIMDDWDETNRCAVNLIASQAGITGGAGAVGASTPRVTLASDDPVTTSVQLLDDAIVADDAAFTPATTKVMVAGFEYDDTTPDSVDEGDAGAARMSANRCQYVMLRDNAGNERGLNVDASGNITVNVTGTVTVGAHAVTNAGTFAVQVDGNALTALQLIDDPVFTDDAAFTPATSKVHMCGFQFDDTLPDSVDEGDAGAARMSANRCQYVMIRDNAGNERGLNVDASGNITVNVTGTVTVGSHAVTNAGTFAVQVDGSALTALQLIDDVVFTDDAAYTPATSKLAVIGAQADETSTDSVDEGDAGALRMTLDRKLHVSAELESNSIRAGGTSMTPKFAIIDAATSGDNTLVAAVASKKIRVLSLFLVASAAVTVRLESGAAGTALTGQMQLAANGGFVLPFNPLGWCETAANTLLNLELSGAISVDGGLVYCEV